MGLPTRLPPQWFVLPAPHLQAESVPAPSLSFSLFPLCPLCPLWPKMEPQRTRRTQRNQRTMRLDAVFEQDDLEIDQQTKTQTGGFQIGNQLHLMNRAEIVRAFQLDDNAIADQQIDPVAVNEYLFVRYDQSFLTLKRDQRFRQLITESFFIHAFQEPWSQSPMNLDGRPNDSFCQLLILGRNRCMAHRYLSPSFL